jgi:hypothetical protein
MKISKEKIMSAIDMNPDEGWTLEDLKVALERIEGNIQKVIDRMEDDYLAYELGDASNLVQVVRESL